MKMIVFKIFFAFYVFILQLLKTVIFKPEFTLFF